MGSLHPVLFFALVYVVALLLSVFICSAIFRKFSSDNPSSGNPPAQFSVRDLSPLTDKSMVFR